MAKEDPLELIAQTLRQQFPELNRRQAANAAGALVREIAAQLRGGADVGTVQFETDGSVVVNRFVVVDADGQSIKKA